MHVEAGRHIQLIESMKRCFPHSQIFSTTHSYQISKNFGKKEELYDLRLLKASDLVKQQPWRLQIADEVKESISKIKSMEIDPVQKEKMIAKGNELCYHCLNQIGEENSSILENCEAFISSTIHLLLNSVVGHKNN